MKGTPPWIAMPKSCSTSSEISGLSTTYVCVLTSSPVRRIAPISAVPSDEPRFVAVYCSPPASPRDRASTEDWMTFPSCEASSPIPAAHERQRDAELERVEFGFDGRKHQQEADEQRDHPDADDAPRRPHRRQARPGERARHQGNRQRQQRDARLERVVAEHDLQEERHREQHARRQQVLHHVHRQPGGQRRNAEKSRCERASASPACRAVRSRCTRTRGAPGRPSPGTASATGPAAQSVSSWGGSSPTGSPAARRTRSTRDPSR